jgi:hypothetical protein
MAAAFLHEADFPPYFDLIAFTHKFCSLHPTAIGREHHDGKITRQLQDYLTKSLRIEIDDVAAECILEGRDIVNVERNETFGADGLEELRGCRVTRFCLPVLASTCEM